jgi:lathosterol oxidase
MVFVVPIHISALGVVLTIATVMGVTNHMGWEMFPRWLVHSRAGEWLITASHHERHHEDYQCNYALYFRFWDKLCGTLSRPWVMRRPPAPACRRNESARPTRAPADGGRPGQRG